MRSSDIYFNGIGTRVSKNSQYLRVYHKPATFLMNIFVILEP